MDMLKRVLGAWFVLTGVAVAVHLPVTPLYHDGSPDYPLWEIMNWFMAGTVLAALVVGLVWKRALGNREAGSVSTLDRVGVNLIFYGVIVLTMWFFWEWFWTLNPASETGDAVTSHLIYFPLVDALYVVVALAIGGRLWNEAGDSANR